MTSQNDKTESEVLDHLHCIGHQIMTSEFGIPDDQAKAIASKIATQFGIDWAGIQIYISKRAALLDSRDTEIFQAFQNGQPMEPILKKHGLTMTRCYQIIRQERDRRAVSKQGKLTS